MRNRLCLKCLLTGRGGFKKHGRRRELSAVLNATADSSLRPSQREKALRALLSCSREPPRSALLNTGPDEGGVLYFCPGLQMTLGPASSSTPGGRWVRDPGLPHPQARAPHPSSPPRSSLPGSRPVRWRPRVPGAERAEARKAIRRAAPQEEATRGGGVRSAAGMDAEYPAFEPPLCSELKHLCRRLQEAYRELKEDLAPCKDDRYYRWARTPARPRLAGASGRGARFLGTRAVFHAWNPEPMGSLREKGTAGFSPLLAPPSPRFLRRSPSPPTPPRSDPAQSGFGETIASPQHLGARAPSLCSRGPRPGRWWKSRVECGRCRGGGTWFQDRAAPR